MGERLRLEKIKLVGFKSFVDPTLLSLKGDLVAVVGPNGCGKSNIIDAVRWGLGESSARQLRGESMSDVIFNGSSSRKPVGQASIEIFFDNSSGVIGGEYAKYNEIAIRRTATRDGESHRFLNGTRCRHKDVKDALSGTGLGSRSYAIIGQGDISRFIEAKPDELRHYLEEAAGISLYKERRKETERRMNHTRENVERLQDNYREGEKLVERLKRQSEAAAKYQVYCEDQRLVEVYLHVLKWNQLQQQLEAWQRDLRTHEIQLEEKAAQRSKLTLSLEQGRLERIEKEDVFHAVQSSYYELGAEIAKREQQLQHQVEQEKQIIVDLKQLEDNLQHNEQEAMLDHGQLAHLQDFEAQLIPEQEAKQQGLRELEMAKAQADRAYRTGAEAWEQFYQASLVPQQAAEVQKAKIEQYEKQARDSCQRLQRLQQALSETQTEPLKIKLATLLAEQEQQATQVQQEQASLEVQLLEIQQRKEALQNQSKSLYAAQTQCQTLKAEQKALEALQKAALGKDNIALQDWLNTRHCLDNPRLAEHIQVKDGFDRAIEIVLNNRLQAVCVEDIHPLSFEDRLSVGELNLLSPPNVFTTSDLKIRHPEWSPLTQKIETQVPLDPWLSGIWVAEDWTTAFARRAQLHDNESIITADGLWLGSHWLKLFGPEGDYSGVLQREAALKKLTERLGAAEALATTLHNEVNVLQETLSDLEQVREADYRRHHQSRHRLSELTTQLSTEQNKIDAIEKRRIQLEQDRQEWQQGLGDLETELGRARALLETALAQMTDFNQQKTTLQSEQQDLKEAQTQAHQAYQSAKEDLHELALRRQQVSHDIKAIQDGLSRLEKQQQQIRQQLMGLKTRLVQLENPMEDLQVQLDALLEQRLREERDLTEARQNLEEMDQALRQWEKERSNLEQIMGEIREQADTLRMNLSATRVHMDNTQEKLQSLGCDSAETFVPNLPEGITIESCQSELTRIIQKIQGLGAINLAAIEEYQVESERMMYLEAQLKDLTEALTTLETAIEKIDKETRVTFKSTFDQVDASFRVLFSKLFIGGEAYLQLTGDDLLNTGITVMARPPGKKNSSIHLLSGGEKALTAVALVFAIFQLNPAPFCLLDEVDAPLDDTNVGRFCELVKYMSKTVQFLFITHNKLAMEMADSLIGVTMKEPGVSRLVAVDVKEAVALAEA